MPAAELVGPEVVAAPGSERRSRPGFSLLVAVLIVFAGCIDSKELRGAFDPCASGGCEPPPPQDCASLSAAEWTIDGLLSSPESEIPLAGSSLSSLFPVVQSHCEPAVVSVDWHVDDSSIVSLTPAHIRSYIWLTGRSLGVASLGARISFIDGAVRQAQPKGVRVVSPAPPQGQVVVQGDLTIPPLVAPGGTGDDWHGWVSFTTATRGRIDVIVDWISLSNNIDFSGYEGHCNAIVACGPIRLMVREEDVKPLRATFDNPPTPPGDFTIRIDNLGPAEETVHYEVRLLPS